MNEIKLIGRLAQDPEVRYTKTGKAVASFTIAVGRGSTSEQQKEATDFIPVVCWQKLGEEVGNTLAKGNRIFLEGRMQTRSYEAADGQKRRVTEVVASFIAQSILDGKTEDRRVNNGADFGVFGRDAIDDEPPF